MSLCLFINASLARDIPLYGQSFQHWGRQGPSHPGAISQQSYSADSNQFGTIDALPREQIIEFIDGILGKACSANNELSAVNPWPRISELQDEPMSVGSPSWDALFYRLRSRGFIVKNLTLIMALVYVDRAAAKLKLWINENTVKRFYGAALIVASKMHHNEVSREQLASILDVEITEMIASETLLVECIGDLVIHPQQLVPYIQTIVGAKQIDLIRGNNVQRTQARQTNFLDYDQ